MKNTQQTQPSQRFRIQRHPSKGSHPVWRLLDGDTLVVTCSYLKGAKALIDYIINYEEHLKQQNKETAE